MVQCNSLNQVNSLAAILFDLDDTLLDRRRSLDRYLAGHATRLALSSASASAYRARFHELDGCGYTSRATLFQQLSLEFPDAGDVDALALDYREHAWRASHLMDGASEALDWCRRIGLACGVVTNGASATQRAKLHSLGIVERVDAVLISEEEGFAKPATEVFHRAASRLGVRPNQCAFVGDNPHTDVDGSHRAGMVAVWFRRELPWPAELPAPSRSIDSLVALRDLRLPFKEQDADERRLRR